MDEGNYKIAFRFTPEAPYASESSSTDLVIYQKLDAGAFVFDEQAPRLNLTVAPVPKPADIEYSIHDDIMTISWFGNGRFDYLLKTSTDLESWEPYDFYRVENEVIFFEFDMNESTKQFFTVETLIR